MATRLRNGRRAFTFWPGTPNSVQSVAPDNLQRATDYLVTGNQRHFPELWKKTKVMGARELIQLLME